MQAGAQRAAALTTLIKYGLPAPGLASTNFSSHAISRHPASCSSPSLPQPPNVAYTHHRSLHSSAGSQRLFIPPLLPQLTSPSSLSDGTNRHKSSPSGVPSAAADLQWTCTQVEASPRDQARHAGSLQRDHVHRPPLLLSNQPHSPMQSSKPPRRRQKVLEFPQPPLSRLR